MKAYKKRYLQRPRELFALMKAMPAHTDKKQTVNPALAEKIRLAVSGVTGCVNCSYLHARYALEKGVNDAEIVRLLNGELGHFPENESVALLYGQHWAETGGHPDAGVRSGVAAYYGEEKTKNIETVIRVLYTGNMISNTVEAHRQGVRSPGNGLRFFLVYLLCLPAAFFIRVSGTKGRIFLRDKHISYLP